MKLYKEGNELVLQVADTGIGIPKEKQKKIFERFYQVENGCEGSGIGLSLVQRLVELHHGRIALQSEVGKGSTFSIYLPQNEEAYTSEELRGGEEDAEKQKVYSTNAHNVYIDDEKEQDEEDIATATQNKRGTILIVEDSKELRQFFGRRIVISIRSA